MLSLALIVVIALGIRAATSTYVGRMAATTPPPAVQLVTVDSDIYGSGQHPANHLEVVLPERYNAPTVAPKAKRLVDTLHHRGTCNTVLYPFRTLELLLKRTSLPIQLEDGRFQLSRRAKLATDKLEAPRPVTTISQLVTVYGPEAPVRIVGGQHAPAGWNNKLVLADGNPDTEALIRAIKHVIMPLEPRIRVGAVESAWMVQNLYDNPSCYLVNFLRLYFKAVLNEAAPKKDLEIMIPKATMVSIMNTYGTDPKNGPQTWADCDGARKAMEEAMGMGISPTAFAYYWGAFEPLLTHINGISDGGVYALKVSAYAAAEYTDGHSRSHKHRLEAAGFKQGLYLYLPFTWDATWFNALNPGDDSFVPRGGPEVERVLAAREPLQHHYIHAKGLTDAELAIAYMAYVPSPRTTPFLVDMDIPLPNTIKKLKFNRPDQPKFKGNPGLVAELNAAKLTGSNIMNVLLKLVQLNRWEEAFFEAIRYISPYVVRPDPDTIEGHAWFGFNPELRLPQLGLARGLHAVFVLDEPLALLHNPATVRACGQATVNALLVQGATIRALYEWGEYLMLLGKERSLRRINEFRDADPLTDIDANKRLAAVVSGVSGVAEDSFAWDGTGVIADPSVLSGLLTPPQIIFDELNDDVKAQLEAGGTVVVATADKWVLSFQHLVPPPGLPLVVGLGGELLRGTPLAPDMVIEMPRAERIRREYGYSMDWLDLWAWTVVHRWQGYDVQYKLPEARDADPMFTGWSANYVSLCPPPPLVPLERDTSLYTARESIVARFHRHSGPMEGVGAGQRRLFSWVLEPVFSSEKIGYRSGYSAYSIGGVPSSIIFTPTYKDLFFGMARVHLQTASDGQDFQVVQSEVRPLGQGALPSASKTDAQTEKVGPPDPVPGTQGNSTPAGDE